jgi:hypothetical protein
MKKVLPALLLFSLIILLTGCGAKDTWQGVYYKHGIEENELYGPIFDNFNACKSWVLGKKSNSDDTYHCIKNCHKALEDGTPICETVVRNTELFPGSDTFDNYKE